MRLARPFYRLPVRFDVERLRAEVAALAASAWAAHPNEIDGNHSVRLISVDGAENDDVKGSMLPTQHLLGSTYIRQVLASFGVVWSRSRLMRLAPGASVPEHADINYHWFNRVRLHIPILTQPEVRFYCGDQDVHMAAGEAWLFDNWRLHRVENRSEHERIHLVADTTGSAAFWRFVAQSTHPKAVERTLAFQPGRELTPLTERTLPAVVMHPAEVEQLVQDFSVELSPATSAPALRDQLAQYQSLLAGFCQDWRQLYALHGENRSGWQEFTKLRDSVVTVSASLGADLVMRTNQMAAPRVLETRLLNHLLQPPPQAAAATAVATRVDRRGIARPVALPRPIFIVAAPRSGSTLLFETLAVSPQLHTLGGEAHWLVEGFPQLRPGQPGVDSNRLDASHYTVELAQQMRAAISTRLQNTDEQPPASGSSPRLLEKTPKNALRIPFFDKLFPDALFIFLWREPRENIGSIMEAWRAGRWITYPQLEGWDGPWSMLLPPDWRSLRGKSLAEVAAYQWETTNRIVLDDLAALPRSRWISVDYADLLVAPGVTIQRLSAFAGIEFDSALQARVAAPLPPSRFTLTTPAPGKWRRDAAAIEAVIDGVGATWQRLQSLRAGPRQNR